MPGPQVKVDIVFPTDDRDLSALDPPSLKRFWIDRGNSLKIRLELVSDGLELESSQDLTDKLASALEITEFWSQLGLKPAIEQPSEDTEHGRNLHSLCISLSITDPDFTDASANQRGRNSFQGSLRCPQGIPTADLNEIILQLRLSRKQIEKSRKKVKSSSRDGSLSTSELNFMCKDEQQSVDLWSSSQPQPELRHTCDILPRLVQSQPLIVSHFEEHYYEDLFEELEDMSASIISNESINLAASIEPENLSERIDHKRKCKDREDGSDGFEFQACLKLIEAALRRLMGDERSRIIPGVKLVTDDSKHKLADISPALFSPGYRQAMDQRCLVLPTISHSLDAMCSRAQTPNLKLAAARALDFQSISLPRRSVMLDNALAREGNALMTTLQERLWRVAESHLFDKGATRRLRPLRLAETHARLQSGQAMLDDEYTAVEDDTVQVLFSDTEGCEDEDHDLLDDFDHYDSKGEDVLLEI